MALLGMKFDDAIITDDYIATGVTAYRKGNNVFINFDGTSLLTLEALGYTTLGTTQFVPNIRIVFDLMDDTNISGYKRSSLFCIIDTQGRIRIYNDTNTAHDAKPRGCVSYMIP